MLISGRSPMMCLMNPKPSSSTSPNWMIMVWWIALVLDLGTNFLTVYVIILIASSTMVARLPFKESVCNDSALALGRLVCTIDLHLSKPTTKAISQAFVTTTIPYFCSLVTTTSKVWAIISWSASMHQRSVMHPSSSSGQCSKNSTFDIAN